MDAKMYSKMPTEFFFQALDGQLISLLWNIKGYVQGILPQLSIHTNNVHICRNWLLWWWWWVIWVPVRISIGVIKRLTSVWITSVRKWNGMQTRGTSGPKWLTWVLFKTSNLLVSVGKWPHPWPKNHNLNKFKSGLLCDATYKVPRLMG